MNAVLVLIGRDLRRSWRPLLGIALVVFVGATSVMVALAGSGRADTSFERFRTAAVDGHAFVGVEDAPERIDEVAELPTVEVFAPFGYVPIVPAGAPQEASIEGGGFASIDGRWLYDVGRPRVLMGRMPDPDESAQMVVNEVFVDMFDVAVGDVVPMEAATAAAMAGMGDHRAVTTVDLEVAAVVRTMMDISANVGGPIVYLPPGFLRANPEVGFVRGFALVRLIGGDASFPEFEATAATTFADEASFTAILISDESRTIQRALDVQVTALLCVAAVAAAAFAALLLQVTSRRIRQTAAASLPLRSIGATRAQHLAVLAAPPLAAAILGVIAGAAASVVLSSELPRGLARVAEPDPGRYIDRAVLAGVGLAALLVTVGCAVLVAVAAGATARTGSSPGALGDRLVRRLHGVGAPLSAMTGLRFALPSRRGARQLGGVASLAGLIVGLAGVIAATAFGARLTDVVADTGAWGTPFDLSASLEDPDSAGEREASTAATIPGVAAVTTVQYVEALDLGEGKAPGYGVEANLGSLAVTSVKGHVPRSNADVLLGTRTAQTLGVGVGDTMRLPTTDGEPVELAVVGLGLLPVAGDGSYDTGVVVLQPTFDRLRHDQGDRSLWIGLADGADVDRVVTALTDVGTDPSRVEPPSEQRNLQSALGYPDLVATIVALLALAGLGSALLAGASSRRVELATLRTFGFTPRQVLESALWQSLAVVVIGLGLAVPLGFVVANATWGTFADSLHLDRSLPYAWGVALTVSAGLLAVAVAAAVPLGTLRARRPPAADLRAE